MTDKGFRILTSVVILAAIGLLAGIVSSIILFKMGEIDYDLFISLCVFLSGSLTMLVILYAAAVSPDIYAREQYAERMKRKRE